MTTSGGRITAAAAVLAWSDAGRRLLQERFARAAARAALLEAGFLPGDEATERAARSKTVAPLRRALARCDTPAARQASLLFGARTAVEALSRVPATALPWLQQALLETWVDCARGDDLLLFLDAARGSPQARGPVVAAAVACARLALRGNEPAIGAARRLLDSADRWVADDDIEPVVRGIGAVREASSPTSRTATAGALQAANLVALSRLPSGHYGVGRAAVEVARSVALALAQDGGPGTLQSRFQRHIATLAEVVRATVACPELVPEET